MSISSIRNKFLWFINGNRLAVVEKNTDSLGQQGEYISPSESGRTIRIEYISRPLPFDEDLSKSSELPDQFHEALGFKVIAELYRLPGDNFNLQLAQYYDGLYEQQIREGKKYSSRHKISGGYIKPYDY